MWIMVSGPYTSGAKTDAEKQQNLTDMNITAYALLQKGHIPIIGVNLALPIIDAAGADNFDNVMMPVSLAAAERCDACLRIGGPSKGADDEVEIFRAKGLPVYYELAEIPDA